MASGHGRSQAEAQLGHCSPRSGLLLLSHPRPPLGSRARKQRRMEPGSLNHPLQPTPGAQGPASGPQTQAGQGARSHLGNFPEAWRGHVSWDHPFPESELAKSVPPLLLSPQGSRGPGHLPLRLDADATRYRTPVLACTLLWRWQERRQRQEDSLPPAGSFIQSMYRESAQHLSGANTKQIGSSGLNTQNRKKTPRHSCSFLVNVSCKLSQAVSCTLHVSVWGGSPETWSW